MSRGNYTFYSAMRREHRNKLTKRYRITQFIKDVDTLLLWLFTDRKRITLYLLFTGIFQGRSNCIEQVKMYSKEEVKLQLKK